MLTHKDIGISWDCSRGEPHRKCHYPGIEQLYNRHISINNNQQLKISRNIEIKVFVMWRTGCYVPLSINDIFNNHRIWSDIQPFTVETPIGKFET